jgi:hypothetical protein
MRITPAKYASEPKDTPTSRRLGRECGAADQAVCLALMAAGIHDRDFISPGGPPEKQTPIEAALVRLWRAHFKEVDYWRTRTARLARQLQRMARRRKGGAR